MTDTFIKITSSCRGVLISGGAVDGVYVDPFPNVEAGEAMIRLSGPWGDAILTLRPGMAAQLVDQLAPFA